ncbi:MAG: hypothetical protein ACPKOI_08910 [Pleomorphochaeta sp.]
MKKSKIFIVILIIFLLISCATTKTENYDFNDNLVSVNCNINDFDNKAVELSIHNNTNENILLIFTEAKVLDKNNQMVALYRLEDALSDSNSVRIENVELSPNSILQDKFVAVGHIKKQIIKKEFVVLPWLDSNKFILELPYMIGNEKRLIRISF